MFRSSLLAACLSIGVMGSASAAMMQFQAALDGKSEVPAKTTSGTGEALATLDTASKTLYYTVTFQGLSGPAAAAHFHGPAMAGANAGVVVPIGGKGPESPVSGKATLTDEQIKDLEAGKWYVNVHTAANPGGEIRGQVMQVGGGMMTKPGMGTRSDMPMKHDAPMKH